MIDNFEQIRSMLKLEHELEESYFYFIQIIQRKKENPGLCSSNRIIRSYNIDSLKKFDKNKDEIIKLCETFNARAYIHLNRRKWSSICLECLRHNAELIANSQYSGIKSSFETIIGRTNGESNATKTWIIDVDMNDLEVVSKIERIINSIEPIDKTVTKLMHTIPTKNGYHMITKPFDRTEFAKYMQLQGDVPDIHTDNPTLLYVA
jgi:hypothetical protein